MFGYLSEVFSEELCLPLAKLEFKRENFTLKETAMACFKVFQFKKNSFDLSSGFQNEFHLGEKPILHSLLRAWCDILVLPQTYLIRQFLYLPLQLKENCPGIAPNCMTLAKIFAKVPKFSILIWFNLKTF